MSGYDIQYWFSTLWYDLTHPGSADVPMIIFKLVVLFFGFLFAKAILGILWRVLYVETLRPILEPIFKVVFFPFRLPWIIGRWLKRRSDEKRHARENQLWQQRRAQEEQQRIAMQTAEDQRREQERIAEMVRLQHEGRIR